jgi:DNA-binding SARP family transcriptional activator/tetratricopeptide (TPR) repeat protein
VKTLKLLGRIDLKSGNGPSDNTALRGSKRLALLTFLASTPPGGFRRRDEIVGVLWGDTTDEKGRTAFRTSLHGLRSALGGEIVRNRGREDVGLDPRFIQVDVSEFWGAIEEGRLEDAVRTYGGALAPGLHVEGAPSFMEWLELERSNLSRRAAQVARTAADVAMGENRRHDAVALLRRATQVDPYDEDTQRKLIRLLVDSSDEGGAVAAYRRFADLLWRDFEGRPSPETAQLIEQFEGVPAAPAVVASPSTGPAPSLESEKNRSGRTTSRWSFGRGISARWLLGAPALAAVGLWMFAAAGATSGSSPYRDSDAVAVFPFAVLGSDGFDYLSVGIPQLLAARLDLPGVLRPIQAPSIERGGARNPGIATDTERARSVSRGFGTRSFVLGSVIEVGGKLALSATVFVGDAEPTVVVVDSENEAGLFDAVDRLAVQVISLLAPSEGELGREAAHTTNSVVALKSFLVGERAFHEGRFRSAIEAFRSAVSVDSTFALAYYGIARAAEWTDESEVVRNAMAGASANAGALPERFQLLLDAKRRFWSGDRRGAERVYREIVTRYPDDVEAHYELADQIFHEGPVNGVPVSESGPGFERVLELDPTNRAARLHLARVWSLNGRAHDADTLLGPLLSEPADARRAEALGFRAMFRGDAAAYADAISELGSLDDPDLLTVLWRLAAFAPEASLARPLMQAALVPTRPKTTQAYGHFIEAEIEASGGRLLSAVERADEASADLAGMGWAARAEMAFIQEFQDDGPSVDALLARGVTPLVPLPASSEFFWPLAGNPLTSSSFRIASLGVLSAAAGNSAGVGESLAAAQQWTGMGGAESLVTLVRAAVMYKEGRPLEAIAALGPVPDDPDTRLPTQWLTPFLVAGWLADVGRTEDALRWYESVPQDLRAGIAFRPIAHLRRARLLAALERTDEALNEYDAFLRLWSNSGPEMEPVVAQVHAEVAALSSGE